jgi:hypothetical protein
MSDWVYCATNAQANQERTANLLRNQQAIWCPPLPLDPLPQAGDRVWLVWRHNSAGGQTFLLGGGRLLRREAATQDTEVYWTDADRPGLLQASIAETYDRQGADTAFLLLDVVAVFDPPFQNVPGLGVMDSGLNRVTAGRLAVLQPLLQIP